MSTYWHPTSYTSLCFCFSKGRTNSPPFFLISSHRSILSIVLFFFCWVGWRGYSYFFSKSWSLGRRLCDPKSIPIQNVSFSLSIDGLISLELLKVVYNVFEHTYKSQRFDFSLCKLSFIFTLFRLWGHQIDTVKRNSFMCM